MNKKLTINRLAMGNLKTRRKQYTILIIGFILAMGFASGIPFFLSCWQSSAEETQRRLFGTQNAIFLNATDANFEKGTLAELVADYSFAHTIGFAYKDEANADVGTAVAWLEDKAVEMYYPYLYEGRLPEADGEIAIERQSLMTLGLMDKKLGDKITLSMKVPDGKAFSDKTEKRTYTLVGVVCNKKGNLCEWEVPEKAAYFPSAFVNKGEETAIGGKEILIAFLNLIMCDETTSRADTVNNELWDKYYSVSTEYMRIETFHNDRSHNGTSGTDIFNTMLYSIAFATILTLFSCLTIVNSFSNNLRERKKQIGMLRAVGATKRQIISIYAREAFIISLVAAPISVFISYFGVKLITKLMGDDLIFIPEVWILFVGALLGIIVVMCAALIPLIPISKSSPMQAIRNIDYTRKLRKKKIHSQKAFNVSSLLARRNITLSRSRQITVSVILAITVIGSCFGFSGLHHETSETGNRKYKYNLHYNSSYDIALGNCILDYRGYTNNDIAELMSSGYFDQVFATKEGTINILTDEFTDYDIFMLLGSTMGYGIYDEVDKGLTKDNFKYKATENISKSYLKAVERYKYNSLVLPSSFASVDETYLELFEKDVVEGEINIDKINSGEEIILIAPENIGLSLDEMGLNYGYTFLDSHHFSDDNPPDENIELLETQRRTYKVGDEINLSFISASKKDKTNFIRTDRKVKIGAILNSRPKDFGWSFPSIEGFGILTTHQASHLFASDLDYKDIYLQVKGEIDDEKNMIISPYLENISLSIPDGSFTNWYEHERNNERVMRVLFFGLYCIVALFLIICGSVINNALTARIREGKREIGTLRAVGADLKVLSSSYIRQLLVIFGWGYGMGFGLYIIGYVLYIAINKSMNLGKDLFELRIVETFVLCSLLFVICAVNLVLKIRKEMKHSIVENIREL